MRSIGYAAHAALMKRPAASPTETGELEAWARLWEAWATASFLQGYLSASERIPELVGEAPARDKLLRLFMLDRALRELDGELNNRPDWVGIPLTGILDLLDLS